MPAYPLRPAVLALIVGLSVYALEWRASYAADEPDLIFKRSTVFKWVTPNDKLATYGLDGPDIEGVACHFTVPERGGLTGWIGVAEEVSDISLACRQVGPIHFKKKFSQGEDMFRQRRSLFFKKMQIVRGCDVKRNVVVYMVYSDKLIEGSPKNSTSSVPVMPWGSDGQVESAVTGSSIDWFSPACTSFGRHRHFRRHAAEWQPWVNAAIRTAWILKKHAGSSLPIPDQLEHFSFRLNLSRSLPGLIRQSIFLRKWMDARVKPAHDAGESDLHLVTDLSRRAGAVIRMLTSADAPPVGNVGGRDEASTPSVPPYRSGDRRTSGGITARSRAELSHAAGAPDRRLWRR